MSALSLNYPIVLKEPDSCFSRRVLGLADVAFRGVLIHVIGSISAMDLTYFRRQNSSGCSGL
jgi:hypothetical protein